jgi:hypothetical protein
MEFYLVIKKNEILSFAGKWVELDNIILSEVSQVQIDKWSHIFSHMWKTDTIQIQSIIMCTYKYIQNMLLK